MSILESMFLTNWVVTALAATGIGAFISLFNQRFKQDGFALSLLSSFFLSLFWSVPALGLEWPKTPLFYIATVGAALLFCFSDIKHFNMAATYGGGMLSRFRSLVLPIVFVLWLPVSGFFLQENLFTTYMQTPFKTAAMATLIGGMFYVSFWLSRNDRISREGLIFFLPAVVAISLGNILNKIAMSTTDLTSAIILYNFVLWTTKWISLIGFTGIKPALREKYTHFKDKNLWMASACFFGLAIIFNPLKNISFSHTPHPAYVMVIFQMTPFVVSIMYKMVGFKEDANVKVGFLITLLGAMFVGLAISF